MLVFKLKRYHIFTVFLLLLISSFLILFFKKSDYSVSAEENKNFIKYVEFNPCYEALEKAMHEDIKSHNEVNQINWIEILAYLGAKYGGDFKRYNKEDIEKLVQRLKNGENMTDISKNMKNYNYYFEAYGTVLKEFIGDYKIQRKPKKDSDEIILEEVYGLKAFSPIAKTFPFSHYDDFGASRSYGYSRPHLGHDMMCAVGTPVIAVESGTVEIMGWNQYGGWRIGIRSFDKKRYYYYAHLRQNKPFRANLKEGDIVKAGDVIGYVGRTGYSTKENVNNIEQNHLHIGLELIFDESQKESDNEIWIDLYPITRLLEKNKSSVIRNSETKEYSREFDFSEKNLENTLQDNLNNQ